MLADILSFYYLILFLFNVFLGIIIFSKKPSDALSWSVSIIAFSAGIWSFAWFGIIFLESFFWVKMSFWGGFATIAFAIFCLLYPDRRLSSFFKWSFLFIPVIATLTLMPFNLVLLSVESYFPLIFTGTVFNKAIRLYWLLTTILGFFVISKKINKIKSIDIEGLKFFIVGSIIFSFSGIIGNLVIPLVYGNYYFTGLAPATSIIWVSLLSFSILKTDFLKINMIISRITAMIIILIVMVIFAGFLNYVLLSFSSSIMLISIGSLLISYISMNYLPTLRNKIQTYSEKVWVTDWYDEKHLLNLVIKRLSESLDKKDTFLKLCDIFLYELSPRYVALILKNSNESYGGILKQFEKNQKQEKDIHLNDHQRRFLEEKIAATQVEIIDKKAKIFNEFDINGGIWLPFRSLDGFEAAVIIGPKISEANYSQNDLDLMSSVISAVNVFLDRIRPYENIKLEYQEAKQQAEKAGQQIAYANLTKGIAHEIRNPLGMIKGSLDIALKKIDDTDNFEKFVEKAKKNIDRMIKMTTLMLEYGDAKIGDMSAIDINKEIADILMLYESGLMNQGVSLIKQFDDLPEVTIDVGALQQIITNLIQNSVDAMADQSSHRAITISTGFGHFKTESKSYQSVVVSISDTGPGIPSHIQNEVFDSFFTTKAEKHGLGLSIILKLVKQHDGYIELHSTPETNSGCTFKIHFPLPLDI